MDPDHNTMATQLRSVRRWRPSRNQFQILCNFYDQENGTRLHKARRNEIIAALSQHGPITEGNVINWFENRRRQDRARVKRNQRMVSSKDGESDVCPSDRNTPSLQWTPSQDQPRSVRQWRPSRNQFQILWSFYSEENGTRLHKARRKEIIAALSQHGPITEGNVNRWFKKRRRQDRAREKGKQRMASSAQVSSKDGESAVCPPDRNTASLQWTPSQDQPRSVRQWRPSRYQFQILWSFYSQKNGICLHKARRKEIIAALSQHGPITEGNVNHWFKNRRMEDRAREKGKQRMASSAQVSSKESEVCPPDQNTASLQWTPSQDQLETRLQILKKLYDQENGNPDKARLKAIVAALNLHKPMGQTNLILSGLIATEEKRKELIVRIKRDVWYQARQSISSG